ncbi:MAG: NAD(P)/FAD-dependent oxidoreductase [Trueperaceae bacterium]
MSERTFDLLVIGAGMAGLAAARKAASAGKRVAIADARPYGGTCALRGCDPKKVLVGAADIVDAQRRMRDHGVSGQARLDWPALMAFKRTFTEPVPDKLEASLRDVGVTTLHGPTRFVGHEAAEVGTERVTAERFLIATGSRPRPLGIPGEDLVATSTEFLDLEALPARIVFIGGGYVSFEFAHLAARAGAQVIILHRGERPLQRFDPDHVDLLVRASRDLGIDVRLETETASVDAQDGARIVRTNDGDTLEADLVVHGAGRVPELADLDLPSGGIDEDPHGGVRVNEYLQSTTNPRAYAAGDAAATSGPPLTPVAVHEGIVAATNLLRGNQKRPEYAGTPSVVFTLPRLAFAGQSEVEAQEQGLAFDVQSRDTSGWFSARRTRHSFGASKVLVEKGSQRILGAHLLGAHADETIGIFALAIRHGLTARDLKTSILVHPSAASDVASMV